MTQQQALQAFQELRPNSTMLKVSRERSIGYKHGAMNSFYLWDYWGGATIVASSDRSWEHALGIAKAADEDCWPEQDAPFEDEVSA